MAVASLSVLCELDFLFFIYLEGGWGDLGGGNGESGSKHKNVGTIKPGVVVPKAPRGGLQDGGDASLCS